MGKGSSGGTNTVQTVSGPPQQYLDAYTNAYNQATNVAATPYQSYPGQIVANWTPAQQQSLDEVTSAQGAAQPYIDSAQQHFQDATTPLYQNVNKYESPYITDVVNATQKQFDNQNAIQQQGIVGNAVSQGAWGGDRSAIAQAITAGQQQANQAPVIAGLYNSGYNTALGAEEAQGWLNSQAGSGIAGLGAESLNSQLTGANALYGAGAQQQTQNQSQLNVPYQQFLAQQAYPFQTTGWLANIAEGLGSGAGGTSSTKSPAASIGSQIAGLGIGGLGLAGATGGFGSNGWLTGGSGLFSAGGLFGSQGALFGTAADASIAAGGPPLALAALALKRGGRIPHRDAGGPITFGDIPYQQFPVNGSVPQVGVSVIPTFHGQSHPGMGPPKPPQGIAPNQNPPGSLDFSPSGIMGILKSSGATGNNGWLSQMNTAKQGGRILHMAGGGIVPVPSIEEFTAPGGLLDALTERMRHGGIVPRYDDGGDVIATAPIPPPFPTVDDLPSRDSVYGRGIGAPHVVISANDLDPSRGVAPSAGVSMPPKTDRFPVTSMAERMGAVPSGTAALQEGGDQRPDDGWGTAWPMIMHYESSDGKNAGKNYRYDSGHTASGLGQITDTNWHVYGPALGVDVKQYPTADSAPPQMQEAVAHAMYNADQQRGGTGFGDWAPYNAKLAAAVSPTNPTAMAGEVGDGIVPRIHLAQRGDVATDVSPGIVSRGTSSPDAGVGIVPRASSMSPTDASSLTGSGVSPWLALAAAGFGMAAGRSPSALQNIGSGALEGIKVLEQQRQSQPEMRLKIAQAAKAEAEAGAYPALQQWSHEGAVNTLNGRIEAISKGIGNGPETAAVQATPDHAVAPLPGGAPSASAATPVPVTGGGAGASVAPSVSQSMTPEQQKLVSTLDQRRSYIDSQIAHWQNMPTNGIPTLIENQAKMLNGLWDARTKVDQMDPRYAAAAAGMSEAARNPALISRAGEEQKARTAETIEIGGPNRGYVMKGGVPIAALPQSRTVVDPATGQERQEYFTPPLPQQMGGQPQSVVGPNGQPAISKLGPAQQAEMHGIGQDANKEREATLNDAKAAQSQAAILANMDQNAEKIWTGKFSDMVGDAQAYLRVIDPSYDNRVASREQFVKDAGNLTRAATREVSSRAAYQEVQFIQSTLPNPEMSPLGIHRVVGELQGLNDYKIAKAQAMQNWVGSHNGLAAGFENDWQARAPITPYTFIVSRMDQPERQQLFSKWAQTQAGRDELSRMRSQMAYASQNGWLR